MTYTYTPQAGDVIESPDGKTRYLVGNPAQSGYAMIRIYERLNNACCWPTKDTGERERYTHLAALVGGMGWKLVARRGHE